MLNPINRLTDWRRDWVISDVLWLGFASLFVFACNITENLGSYAVLFKRHLTILFLLVTIIFLVGKFVRAADFRQSLIAALSHLPIFLLFVVLVGAGGMASHGVFYASMATNFWDFDPNSPVARRIVLPGLSHMLGIYQAGYVLFWYVIMFVTFCLAADFLRKQKIGVLERMSLLSSSIFAYLLILPGYSEVFVVLCGLYCIGRTLSRGEKIVLAALMLGAHEVAAIFVMLPIILKSDANERLDFLTIWVILIVAYGVGYSVNWQFDWHRALSIALKAGPRDKISSFQWLLQNPGWAFLAIAAAYKLNWLIVINALKLTTVGAQRKLALSVIATLPLMAIATDGSRLIQFGSVGFLMLATEYLPSMSNRRRRYLAFGNLLIPSVYVGTNCGAIWGKGFYLIYLFFAQMVGLKWGGIVL